MDFRNVRWRHFRLADVKFPAARIWLLTILQYVIFFIIFFGSGVINGYRPAQEWKSAAGPGNAEAEFVKRGWSKILF